MSEGMVIAAALPVPEAHSSRLEQRIRVLTEQLVQVRGELRRAEERIAALATVDEETGLLNARAFRERALVEVDRATRYDRPLALVLLKPEDPASLASLAELCRTQCRRVDAVGRTEDDLIALLLPETALPGALVIADRTFTLARNRGVTASAGCAAWPVDGGGLNRLVDAARQALSMARAGGAARVRSTSAARRP